MTTYLRNKLPDLLKDRHINISDFHLLMAQDKNTKLSWSKAHEIATTEIIPDSRSIGIFRKAATALNVPICEVIEIASG